MKIIIIEDEKPSARRLERMITKLGYVVETQLHSVAASVNWLQNNKHPDLILLDIQLSDGLSFKIFEEVQLSSAIIFTTAYDEYALKAFKQNSVDYLLKPIDAEELEVAIDKFKTVRSKEVSLPVNLEQIKALLTNPLENIYKTRFTVKIGQHLKMIPVDDIECVYSENKGTYLYTNSKRDFLLDETMESIGNQLDPKSFFRVNRQFYIRIDAIKDIISYSNSRLKIVLNHYSSQEIIVSREKVKEFKKWLG